MSTLSVKPTTNAGVTGELLEHVRFSVAANLWLPGRQCVSSVFDGATGIWVVLEELYGGSDYLYHWFLHLCQFLRLP